MSSITYYPIIGAFLATLCVHDVLPFIFKFMFQFVFMFHEHVYTYCISFFFFRYQKKKKKERNTICIDVFMKHENELKHEPEYERQYVMNT